MNAVVSISCRPEKSASLWSCLQESREAGVADDLGLSEELDGENQDAAAATRTVQGMPGVMESQSSAAEGSATRVAAERVQSAQAEAQEEQKWQSFMAEHFGGCPPGIADQPQLGQMDVLQTHCL